MAEMPTVDRSALDTDRKRLAGLPADTACELPVGRVRAYLSALAALLPPADDPRASDEAETLSAAFQREAIPRGPLQRALGAFEGAPHIEQWSLTAASGAPAGAERRPWTFRRLARLPGVETMVIIVTGGALLLGTSAWRDDVAQAIGEGLILALVGARALGMTMTREVRKRDPEEAASEDYEEPGFVVSASLFFGTFAVVSVGLREGAALAGVGVSWIGAGLFGMLVALALALEYGVVPPDRFR